VPRDPAFPSAQLFSARRFPPRGRPSDTEGKPMPALDHPVPEALDLDVARSLACRLVAPVAETEFAELAMAAGRTAAASLRADHALPETPRAAVEGFALRAADLGADLRLRIGGDAPAISVLPPGTALRIGAGVPLPAGADTVVALEHCSETGATVTLPALPELGAHIRAAGSEQPEGGVLLRKGARVRAHHLGLLAANGVSTLEVLRRPRLAILSTGDEFRPGADLLPEVNRPMLQTLARMAGAEVEDLGLLPDAPEAIAARLQDLAGRYDLIVTTGGVSLGGRDLLRPALIAAGGQIEGWRVALKPGKPVLFGRLGTTALTGLPGNPFSALVGFTLFVTAQIARLKGAVPMPPFHCAGRAGFDWTRKPGRAEVFPIRLGNREIDGLPVVQRLGEGISATLFPLAEADGLGFVPSATTRVSVGTPIAWQTFEAAAR